MMFLLLLVVLLPVLTPARELRTESRAESPVWRAEVVEEQEMRGASSRHCSSPTGSVDGKILVEDDGGQMTDFTTITWQIGQYRGG